jgi:hypothetical protein
MTCGSTPAAIERSINGQRAEQRRAVRRELSAPLAADLESWMREQRAKLSRGNEVAKAMEYMLKRWTAFNSLPRRWPHLLVKQCSGTSVARNSEA